MGTIIAATYLGVAAAFAASIVWSGVTGRWSNDDWPVFAVLVPWVWPALGPIMFVGLFGDNVLHPAFHRDGCVCRREVIRNPLKWHD